MSSIIVNFSPMEALFYTYIFIFGLLFWSFSSVIISRLRNGKNGIIKGRSECPKCHHTLTGKDLIPLFSFLQTAGKCRYCKTPIPYFYPFLELTFGLGFVITTFFFSDVSLILQGNMEELLRLIFFLLLSFWTLLYVIYDILYYEIPDSVLISLIALSTFALGVQSFGFMSFFPSLENTLLLTNWEHLLLIWAFIISIAWFYAIMLKWLEYIHDFLILWSISLLWIGIMFLWIPLTQTVFWSAFLGAFALFFFLYLQIVLSNWRAMGGWDLRIAILMGMILWISLSFWGMLLTYMIGSTIGIFVILYAKTRQYYNNKKQTLNKVRRILGMREKKVELDTHIPFGPFLALGMYGALLYGNEIRIFFQNYL